MACTAADVAKKVLQKARSKLEGDALFNKLKGPEGDALAAELGIPNSATLEDLDDAYRRCMPMWLRDSQSEIEFLVQHTLQKCTSLMDVDRQMRSLQSKIGRRLAGRGTLTEEILTAAHSKCHEYWARVTPGNVSAIVSNVKSKCNNWESAAKKFDWLWSKGSWSQDGRHMTLGSRTLSAEDLNQAERQCRRSFDLPGTAEVRRIPRPPPPGQPGGSPQTSALPTPSSAPAPREPAAPTAAPSAPVTALPEAADPQPQGTPGAVPLPAPELPKPPAPPLSNADFIVENILKKCASEESAKKFFAWLRSDEGKRIKGRVLSAADVDEAIQKCRKVWAERSKAKSSGSSSSSSSSEDERKPAPRRQRPAAGAETTPAAPPKAAPREAAEDDAGVAGDDGASNVEFLVNEVMQKATSMSKAEKIFDKLHGSVGSMTQFGRTFTEQEITEAWLTVSTMLEAGEATKQAAKEARRAEKAQKAAEKAERKAKKYDADKNVNNVEVIIKYVLRKCQDASKAEKIFDKLRGTIGAESFLGRAFTDQEITEAWFRCTEVFEVQAAEEAAEEEEEEEGEGGDDSEGGSSSSYEPEQRKRGRKGGAKEGRKDKLKRSKTQKYDEELEGALFNDSSDDSLDAEEQVDAEDESMAAEMMADLGEYEEPQPVDDGYPAQDWLDTAPGLHPGSDGFNHRAAAVMTKSCVGQSKLHVKFDANAACPPLQPHQESVGFLLHPKSPVSRLLVDHPTGSGKTREMIKVLDNYFFDPRPKVPIFPKDPVCRNFYSELLRWPSRYRDYFCCERPADAAICCQQVATRAHKGAADGAADQASAPKPGGAPTWKEFRFHMWDLSNFTEGEARRLGYAIREVLEMKGMFFMGRVRTSLRAAFHRRHPGEFMPAAPLRAINYTSAGGAFSALTPAGKPVSCLMKIGFQKGSANVYSSKIVLMDETHNLVRTQTQYGEQLQRLRDLLKSAGSLVLAGFTGTPILNEPTEGRQLLDIIKGEGAPEGDEGFLSSFPMRPQPLFPVSLPRGLPDGVLTASRRRQLCTKVEIHGETLKIYDLKRRLQLPPRRLRAYCNVSTFHATFHDGKNGSKVKVLTFPEEHAPKFLAIAHEVASSPLKAVVMTGRLSGHVVMLELMRFIAAKADPPFGVATMDELQQFNHVSNLRGEVYRVLVADAAQCSEGVSFLSVRRTFLSDVPTTPSMFIQQCGRAIRMYGHRGLPEEEQVVTTKLYVATFPRWLRGSSLACWALRAQKKHTSGKEVEKRGRILTARLNRAGVKTLEDLKARIEKHAEAKRRAMNGGDNEMPAEKPAEKVALTSEDVITFLEQNGLTEEARLLRQSDKKEKEKEKVLEDSKASLAKGAAEEGSSLRRLESADSLGAEGGSSLGRLGSTDSLGRGGVGRAGTMDSMDLEDSLAEAIDGALGESQDDAKDAFAAALEDALEEEGVLPTGEADAEPVAEEAAAVEAAAAAVSAAVSEPAFSQAMVAASAGASKAASGAATAAGGGGVEAPAAAAQDIPPEEAVAQALQVVRKVCSALNKSQGAAPQAPPAGEGDLENDADAPAEPAWKAQLEKGLERLRHSEAVGAALRAAVHPSFEAATDDLRELGPEQVKALRDELLKLEKIANVAKALAVLKDVRAMIDQSALLAMRAAEQARLETALAGSARTTIEPVAQAPEGDGAPSAAAATGQQPAADGAASGALVPAAVDQVLDGDGATAVVATERQPDRPVADGAASGALVPAAGQEAGRADGAASGALVPAVGPEAEPVAVGGQIVPATAAGADSGTAGATGVAIASAPAASEEASSCAKEERRAMEEQHREAERAWRQRLREGLRELKGSDYIRVALKVAAPSLLSSEDDALEALTPDIVKRLHDEFARLQEQAEKGGVRPRALVRAMQQLYLAESCRDASLSLSTETADEEALRQLTERTEEFAPALDMMRTLAVDKAIFAHLADADEEANEEHASEEDVDDLDYERELVSRQDSGLVLPDGWSVEWVQTGKRQMKHFIDQDGRRYTSHRQARAALAELEACRAEAERIAAENAASLAAAAAAPDGGPKRVRLRGKVSEASLGESLFGAGGLEAAFEEALGDALGEIIGSANGAENGKSGTAVKSGVQKAATPSPEAKPGAKVVLKGLVAKPELNGQQGRLLAYNTQTGRWETQLADRSKVNVKPANFDVVAPRALILATKGQPKKRPAPSPAPGAPPSKAPAAEGRGRGRGRGRGAARGGAARGGASSSGGAALAGGGSESD